MKTSLTFNTNNWESLPLKTIVEKLFSEEEVEKICKYCSENDGELRDGLTFGSKPEDIDKIKQIRNSKIKFVKINKENSWIFKRLKNIIEKVNDDFYNFELVGFDKFQYSEYNSEGSKYDFHIDCFLGEKNVNLMRKMSVSLLLSDPEKDYEGGDFELSVGQTQKINQKKGTAVFFPSFVMHRVSPIVKGNRKSIVIWVLGPKFK